MLASAVAAKLLNAGFAAQSGAGMGGLEQPHVALLSPVLCLVWTGPLAGEPKAPCRHKQTDHLIHCSEP